MMDKKILIEKLSVIADELENSNYHSDITDINLLINIISVDSDDIKNIKLINKVKEHCLSHRGYLDISGGKFRWILGLIY